MVLSQHAPRSQDVIRVAVIGTGENLLRDQPGVLPDRRLDLAGHVPTGLRAFLFADEFHHPPHRRMPQHVVIDRVNGRGEDAYQDLIGGRRRLFDLGVPEPVGQSPLVIDDRFHTLTKRVPSRKMFV